MKNEFNSQAYYQGLQFVRLSTYSFNRGQNADQPSVYLTNGYGHLHPTSRLIIRLAAADPEVAELAAILQTELVDDSRWMCAPIYRDAIIFFNAENQVVSILNICLECSSLLTGEGQDVPLDFNAYPRLTEWLKKLGHPIGDKAVA
jgi:hypothetical protein